MGELMATWAGAIVEEVLKQLKPEGDLPEINLDSILDIMENEASTLEKDLSISEINPWFAACLKVAAQILYKPDEYEGDLLPWGKFLYIILPADSGKYGLLEEAFTAVQSPFMFLTFTRFFLFYYVLIKCFWQQAAGEMKPSPSCSLVSIILTSIQTFLCF